MLDQQVVADCIKRIFVPARGKRLSQAFVEFEVEDLKPQRLSSSDFVPISRQMRYVMRGRDNDQADGIQCRFLIQCRSSALNMGRACRPNLTGGLLLAGLELLFDAFASLRRKPLWNCRARVFLAFMSSRT